MDNAIVFGKYKLHGKIGEGTYGYLFDCEDIETGNLYVAKIEKHGITSSHCLQNEYEIYIKLHNPDKGVGNVYAFGEQYGYNILIIDRFGMNLETFFNKNNRKLPLETILSFGLEILNILEYFYENGYVYRDVKSDNFVLYDRRIFIIDFGLSGKTNTNDYTMLDDLLDLGFMLVYFLFGKLPWDKRINTAEEISSTKYRFIHNICAFALPICIETYIKTIGKMNEGEPIDFWHLKRIFWIE